MGKFRDDDTRRGAAWERVDLFILCGSDSVFQIPFFVSHLIPKRLKGYNYWPARVEGGCCAKTVSSEADTPSPPEGFRRLSVSRRGYVCFYKVLPREDFSLTSGAGSLLATNASEHEAGRGKKNSNHQQSPLIDFLATLWHLTLVMGNTGNDSLSSPADK